MKPRRPLREQLVDGHPMLGLLQSHPSTMLLEMAAICGYDFLLLDGEHGVFAEQDYLDALRTMAAFEAWTLVRLPNHDLQAVGRYADMGADGIVVPNVCTAEQARALALALEYPPAGTRGVGASLHRATRYGMDAASHLKAPRENVSLFPIIESAAGAANIDGILAVPGIDGVIIGPADLAADLGCAGDFSRSDFMEAVTRIERAARAHYKALGTAPHAGSPIDILLARGHRLLIVGSDVSVVREAMSAQVAKARASLHAASKDPHEVT